MRFFQRYSTALDELIESRSPDQLTPSESQGLWTLDLHRLGVRCSARVPHTLPNRSVMWDAQLDLFKAKLELAERILGVSPRPLSLSLDSEPRPLPERVDSVAQQSVAAPLTLSKSPSKSVTLPPLSSISRASYCPDLNVLPPIFAVIHRCRDPILRRRAIHILQVSNCQEGFHDSLLIAIVGERVLEIEEPHPGIVSAAEIPAEARLDAIYVRLREGTSLSKDGAIVEFRRPRAGGKPEPSKSGLSTMIADDDALWQDIYGSKDDARSITWLERIKWSREGILT